MRRKSADPPGRRPGRVAYALLCALAVLAAFTASAQLRENDARWVAAPADVLSAWEALVAAPEPTIGATIRDSMRLLSRDVLGYAPFSFTDIRWHRVDLNRDGRPEIIFVLEHPTFCGMAVCSLVVMGRVGPQDQWLVLCESEAGAGNAALTVLSAITNGWHWFRSEITTAWRASRVAPAGVECRAQHQP